VLVTLKHEHAKQIPSLSALGLVGKNLPVSLLCGLQASGLMVGGCRGQLLGNRGHAGIMVAPRVSDELFVSGTKKMREVNGAVTAAGFATMPVATASRRA
jgi:hypothetical protein